MDVEEKRKGVVNRHKGRPGSYQIRKGYRKTGANEEKLIFRPSRKPTKFPIKTFFQPLPSRTEP